MSPVSNAIIGALIAQDLFLLVDAVAGMPCDETERLLETLHIETQIDLITATTEDIVNQTEKLRQFQDKHQEYLLNVIIEKQKKEMDSVIEQKGLNFRQKLGAFLIILSLVYVICLTWIPVPEINQRFADTSLGFILATIVSTLINFFYGTSDNPTTTKKDTPMTNIQPSKMKGMGRHNGKC